ncbi:L-alanine-DL-glutamate epimerase-like enolase superfamily enzyme [Bradyrhizobium ottawaense]
MAVTDISGAPVVTAMQVIPVAGRDSMLLNLSGAHAPFFTRNIVILTDNAGHTGVGEVPGGQKIWQTLQDARDLVIGKTVGALNNILADVRTAFADRDAGGRGKQTFDLRVMIHAVTAIDCLICLASISTCPSPRCSAKASNAIASRRSAISSSSATGASRS